MSVRVEKRWLRAVMKGFVIRLKSSWNVNWWKRRNFNVNVSDAHAHAHVQCACSGVFTSAQHSTALIWNGISIENHLKRIDGCTCNWTAIICLWMVFITFKTRADLHFLHMFSLSFPCTLYISTHIFCVCACTRVTEKERKHQNQEYLIWEFHERLFQSFSFFGNNFNYFSLG